MLSNSRTAPPLPCLTGSRWRGWSTSSVLTRIWRRNLRFTSTRTTNYQSATKIWMTTFFCDPSHVYIHISEVSQ